MRVHRPSELPTSYRPRVTVAIPCYNYADFLPGAVASALDQANVDVDVVIVDNASTDASVDVAEEIVANDSRVRLIRHATNQGHIASFNEGVHSATGDYVVLLCADDLLTKDSLTRSVALLDAHPNVAFTYGYARQFTGEPPVQPRQATRGWLVWPGEQWVRARFRTGRNVVLNPEVVMRRKVMDQLDYDIRFVNTSDLHLWLRAAMLGDVGYVLGPCQGLCRTHANSLSSQYVAGVLNHFTAVRSVFDTVGQEEARRLSHTGALDQNARRALARRALEFARRCHDRDDDFGGSMAEQYAAFARETWSPISQSLSWRGYQRRADGRLPAAWQISAERLNVIRDKVRWRTWRGLGI